MQRRLIVLSGTPDTTRSRAARLLVEFPPQSVLWAGGDGATAADVRRLLGTTFMACVVDCHEGLDADLLAQCHGFVVGGGALIVRFDPHPPLQRGLAAFGYSEADVTHHLYDRLRRVLSDAESSHEALQVPTFRPTGSSDQDQVVAALRRHARTAGIAILTANRGRGKSTALGLALREIEGPVVVTAENEEAVREVFAFAPAEERIVFRPAPELLTSVEAPALVVVDEAAQLPVALLRELVERFPDTPIVFSTTTHGYEGTGRGFSLRFVAGLRRGPRPLTELVLTTPIRWGVDDPVEAAIFDALLLDAEPARAPKATSAPRHRAVTSQELAADEWLLREIFGLLVHAHYRTTPGDLHRLLDAPNLDVHASFLDGHVVAATLVAREGGISRGVAQELAAGKMRLVGHALPETFAAHLGRADAAELTMIRSVRIATHHEFRRSGIASGLVDHVHRSYEADLFGTLFGAAPELLNFRRSLGYELVRLSASRGRRTGVPSVTMVRPVSPRAAALMAELRADLARDLPVQLELCASDGALDLSNELRDSLLAGLGEPSLMSPEQREHMVRSYAFGPRTLESAAVAVGEFVASRPLDGLSEQERILLQSRVLERDSWVVAASRAQMPTLPAAMRAVRRAVRRLVEA